MSWNEFILEQSNKDYYQKLMTFVNEEYQKNQCFPPYDEIFNAFKLTPYENVKVVILGQDPYHNKGEAHGLAFSVKCKKIPPSLKNIYKEMSQDLNVLVNQDGDLTYLARQGVFLLNTTLTVRLNEPLSHKNKGWEIFTDNVISYLDKKQTPIVFILWGSKAIAKKKLLTNPNHLVITSPHPSPLGAYRGFFGSKPFSKTNEFLIKNHIEPIKWIKA